MGERIIQKAIEINAAVDKVWRVFTDPAITRQMGGEYVTDWKVGSSFGWKGKDGNIYTHGAILQLEKESLLKHNLFDAAQKVLSVITYRFIDKNGQTTLLAQEELNYEVTEEQLEEAMEGWDAAFDFGKKDCRKIINLTRRIFLTIGNIMRFFLDSEQCMSVHGIIIESLFQQVTAFRR